LIDLDTTERRLRTTLSEVANLPTGALHPVTNPATGRHGIRPAGVRRVLGYTLAVVLTAAVVLVAAFVPAQRGSSHQARGSAPMSTRARRGATSSTTTTLPSNIPGFQQTLQQATPYPFSDFGNLAGTLVPGSVRAFTVAGTPKFEVAETTNNDPKYPLVLMPVDEFLGFYNLIGTDPPASVGFQGGGQPIAPPSAVKISVVENIPDWPKLGEQVYVWTQLPASTAYVTYTFEGDTSAWEESVDGVVAFLVPRPAAWDGEPYSACRASNPVLRAFDAQGDFLGQASAPCADGQSRP